MSDCKHVEGTSVVIRNNGNKPVWIEIYENDKATSICRLLPGCETLTNEFHLGGGRTLRVMEEVD